MNLITIIIYKRNILIRYKLLYAKKIEFNNNFFN